MHLLTYLSIYTDARVIKCESRPGEVIKADDLRVIHGEGMPIHGSPFTKGRLFIIFKVEFPAAGSLTAQQIKALEAVLPPKTVPRLTGEEEEVSLVPIDPSQITQSDGSAMDDDDEDGRGPQRVQCQNM